GAGFEANGTTPLGVTPGVVVLDNVGNDVPMVVLNFTQPGLNLPNPTFRLDNSAPQPPTFFGTPGRQAGWVNAAYTFTGTGGNSFSAATGTTKYVSCGDGSNVATPSGAGYVCSFNQAVPVAQVGVSAGGIGNSGTNGLTSFTYYSM